MSGALLLSVALAIPTQNPGRDTLWVVADNSPVWGADLRMEEELRIGALDGDVFETFGAIAGVVVGSTGTIYVADRQALTIRVFGVDGSYAGSLGQEGEGPGEFRSIDGLALLPRDRVIIKDTRRARAIIYDSGGQVESEFQLFTGLYSVDVTFQADTVGRTYVLAVDRSQPIPARQVVDEFPMVWIRHGADGAVLDSIPVPREDAEGSYTFITPEGPRHPFTVETLSALSPAGYLIWGRNDQYAFHRQFPDGRIVRVTRTDDRPKVSPEERREWEAASAYVERRGSTEDHSIPDRKPYFRELSADIQGRIWVQRYTEPTHRYEYTAEELQARGDRPAIELRESQTFDVFEPEGRFLGTVALPPNARLAFARQRQVWTVEVGDFDEQYVIRYSLVADGL